MYFRLDEYGDNVQIVGKADDGTGWEEVLATIPASDFDNMARVWLANRWLERTMKDEQDPSGNPGG